MDYSAEIREFLRAKGVRDERFIQEFLQDQAKDIKAEFAEAGEGERHLDDILGLVLDMAKSRYQYWIKATVKQGELPVQAALQQRKTEKVDSKRRQQFLALFLTEQLQNSGSDLLEGRLLSSDEAMHLIESPVAAQYSSQAIRRYGLDAILDATILAKSEESIQRVSVQSEQTEDILEVRPIGRTPKRLIFPGRTISYLVVDAVEAITEIEYLPCPHRPNRRIVVHPKSLLAALARPARWLAKHYPIQPDKALWFILTGEFLPSPPVKVEYEDIQVHAYTRTKITLEIESWVTAEEVAQHYRNAQKFLLKKIPRSLDARSLAVLEFVSCNKESTWEKLVKDWNKEHPAWRYSHAGALHQKHSRSLAKLRNANA